MISATSRKDNRLKDRGKETDIYASPIVQHICCYVPLQWAHKDHRRIRYDRLLQLVESIRDILLYLWLIVCLEGNLLLMYVPWCVGVCVRRGAVCVGRCVQQGVLLTVCFGRWIKQKQLLIKQRQVWKSTAMCWVVWMCVVGSMSGGGLGDGGACC
jgi:hypothetical protein